MAPPRGTDNFGVQKIPAIFSQVSENSTRNRRKIATLGALRERGTSEKKSIFGPGHPWVGVTGIPASGSLMEGP